MQRFRSTPAQLTPSDLDAILLEMSAPASKVAELAAALGGTAFAVDDFLVRRTVRDAEKLVGEVNSADAAIVYAVLGHGYARLGKIKEAYEANRKASQIEPRNPVYHNNMGTYLFHAGDLHGAIDAWVKAIDLSDGDSPSEQTKQSRAITFANLAEVFAQLGDLESATEAMTSSMKELARLNADPNTLVIIAQQAALIDEDDLALELLARAMSALAQSPRGSRSPIEVIDSHPEWMARLAPCRALEGTVAKARMFGHLRRDSLSVRPRHRGASPGAEEVFDSWTPLRMAATREGVGQE